MKKPTLAQRLKYWFDGVMARGTGALLGVLALATAVVIAVTAVVVYFLNVDQGTERPEFVMVIWDNLIRTLGTDDVADKSGWAFRIAMIFIAFIGVFVVANLIGIVSGAFDAKVAELRKGRSTVLASGHTVILGWNSKMATIIESLCEANASSKRARDRHPRGARQGGDGGRDPLAHPQARPDHHHLQVREPARPGRPPHRRTPSTPRPSSS